MFAATSVEHPKRANSTIQALVESGSNVDDAFAIRRNLRVGSPLQCKYIFGLEGSEGIGFGDDTKGANEGCNGSEDERLHRDVLLLQD